MRRYRGSAAVAAAKKEREGALEHALHTEIDTFYALSKQVQLPWIDLHWIRHHIFEDPPINVSDLPILTSLNGLLAQQLELSSKIRLLCDAREGLLGELLSVGEGCLSGRNSPENHPNHDHGGGGEIGEEKHHKDEKEEEESSFCSASNHILICEKIEEIDIYTDAIVALIGQWRKNLTFPLPFMYKGENYLSRLYREYSSSGPSSSVSPSSAVAAVTKPSKQNFREDAKEKEELDIEVCGVSVSPSASLSLLLAHIRNAMIASRSKEAADTTISSKTKGSAAEGWEKEMKEINGREVASAKTTAVATTAASSLSTPPPPTALLYVSPYDLAVSFSGGVGVGVGGGNSFKKTPHRQQQVNPLLPQHRSTTSSKHPQQQHIGRAAIESEAARQLLVIEEMLDLAKRGHYAPVLKMSRWLTPKNKEATHATVGVAEGGDGEGRGRRRVVVGGISNKISSRRAEAIMATRTSRLIPITNRKWKERLLMCFAGARHDLLATINATAATNIATEFVQGSERALTGRYYHKWAEWIYKKRERRREAAELAKFSEMCHLSMRFDGWLSLREISRRRRAGLEKIRSEALRSLAGRCLRRWFLALKISALRLTVAQSVTKRYFRAWLFVALSCRVWPKRQNKPIIEMIEDLKEVEERPRVTLTAPSSGVAEEDNAEVGIRSSPNLKIMMDYGENEQPSAANQHQHQAAQPQLSAPRQLTTSEMISLIRCDLKYLTMVVNMGEHMMTRGCPSRSFGPTQSHSSMPYDQDQTVSPTPELN